MERKNIVSETTEFAYSDDELELEMVDLDERDLPTDLGDLAGYCSSCCCCC